jgi:hypothetical protein
MTFGAKCPSDFRLEPHGVPRGITLASVNHYHNKKSRRNRTPESIPPRRLTS